MEQNKSINKNRAMSVLVMVIIVLQTVFVTYVASKKEEFHIDEIYSYILSNSHEVHRISDSDKIWNQWIDTEIWDTFTTVQKGEKFDYPTVYYNNTKDAHPPLFYWCLNTVCSFFPDNFSMWFGIGMNIFFYAFSLFIMFLISKRLLKNKYMQLIPMLLWGFSSAAVDTAIFIRMYSLLTFLTLLFVLMNLKLFQEGYTKKNLGFAFLITFLGAMTQYYFIVIAFSIVLIHCFYLLIKKQYKTMWIYGILETFAIALLFVAYPAAVVQITGSPTNNIGKEVAATFFSLSGWLKTVLIYARQIIGSCINLPHSVFEIVLLGLLGVGVIVCSYFTNIKTNIKIEKSLNFKDLLTICVYAAAVLFYIIVISKLSYKFVYVRYLYHIIPLVFIIGVMFIEWICKSLKLHINSVCCLLAAISVLSASNIIKYNICSYLFEDAKTFNENIMTEYGDVPIILLQEKSTYVLTMNYTLFKEYSNVYATSLENAGELSDVLSMRDTSKGFLLFLWTDTEWSNGYIKEDALTLVKENCPEFEAYTYLGNRNFCDIYYVK